MFAVVQMGGKQFRVEPDQLVEIEKLPGEKGDTVTFDRVLLVSSGEDLRVGTPAVAGASVVAQIVAQTQGPKIRVGKYRRRKNSRRVTGHRQQLTAIRIQEIRL